MKFVLIVEGYTEHTAVPEFLRRWINSRESLPRKVGVDAVNLKGGGKELLDRIVSKAEHYLKGPGQDLDIIAVLGMLDLYNPSFDELWNANGLSTVEKRYDWAVNEIPPRVNHEQFRMFFAVHEVEAWLLSQPENLRVKLSTPDLEKCKRPEEINFITPPSRWLNQRYKRELKKNYKKVVDGSQLFSKLKPDVAYDKCPYLRKMLDELERLAMAALRTA
jgi:hypothetical protein